MKHATLDTKTIAAAYFKSDLLRKPPLLVTMAVAMRFSEKLYALLGSTKMQTIIERNHTPRYLSGRLCATHDFCDSNMVMAEAITREIGRECNPDNDKHMTVFDHAWAIARDHDFNVHRIAVADHV